MRVKRHREHRRNIAFLRTALGFRPPFKVLCDGNFIHHCLAVGVAPPAVSIPKLLGAATKVYTTRCVIAELQRLGAAVTAARLAARKMSLIHCDHSSTAAAMIAGNLSSAAVPSAAIGAPAAEQQENGVDEGPIPGTSGSAQREAAGGVGDGDSGEEEAGGLGEEAEVSAETHVESPKPTGRPPAHSSEANGTIINRQGTGGRVPVLKPALQSRAKGNHGVVTVAAAECLQQLVAGSNPQHFLVASQDEELCRALRKLPASAVIHAKGTAISLLPPSKAQLATARSSETARRVLPQHEAAQLKQLRAARKKKRLEAASQGLARDDGEVQLLNDASNDGGTDMRDAREGGVNDEEGAGGEGTDKKDHELLEDAVDMRSNGSEKNRSSEAVRGRGPVSRLDRGGSAVDVDSDDERGQERKDWRKLGYVKDKARFKRKFVKGPNPLSCKKRTKKAAQPVAPVPEAVETKRRGRARRKKQHDD